MPNGKVRFGGTFGRDTRDQPEQFEGNHPVHGGMSWKFFEGNGHRVRCVELEMHRPGSRPMNTCPR